VYKDLSSNMTFKWLDKLFSSSGQSPANLNINIPADLITTSSVIDLITVNGTSMPFAIPSLSISPLKQQPGFSAEGLINLHIPEGLPRVAMDLGYFSSKVQINSVPLLKAESSTGIHVSTYPNASPSRLDASIILSPKSPALTSALQSFVDSVTRYANGNTDNFTLPLNDSLSPLEITGLIFGPSSSNSIISFSKIVAQLSGEAVGNLTSKVVDHVNHYVSETAKSIVAVQTADLSVESSTKVNTQIGSLIRNPSNISVTLGSVNANIFLDNSKLVGISIPGAIELKSGEAPLALKIGMDLVKEDGTISGKIGQVINAAVAVPSAFSANGVPVIKVSGLSMSGGLDQLSDVYITVPPALLDRLNPLQELNQEPNSKTFAIDISALVPDGNILNRMNLSINAMDFEVASSSQLNFGGSFGYAVEIIMINNIYVSFVGIII
jgi:hypothetical protein